MSRQRTFRIGATIALLLLSLHLAGCGSKPYRPTGQVPERQQVIEAARDMLGIPYRYGGTSPTRGFDCSGLVQYAYRQAGIKVPRTTGEQYRAALPLKRQALRPGDVVFFRTHGQRFVSHVGIYLGQGKFIHAPSSGKHVSINSLQDDYWRRRYTSGGRMF
jgi:cell wall-associated NlpC family hydrolase